MGLIIAAIGTIFWATTSVVTRQAGFSVQRDRGLVISITSNAFFNVVWVVIRLLWGGPLVFNLWGVLAFLAGGIFATFVGRWCWFRSIELVGPSRASTFKNTQPLFTLTIAALLLHEPASLRGVLGALLVVAAVLLLGQEHRMTAPGSVTPAGAWWGLGAAGSFAVGNILRKVGVTIWQEPVMGAFLGTVAAVAGVWLTPQGMAQGRKLFGTQWGSGEKLFVLTGALTSTAQQFFFYAISLAPVWKVNVVNAAEPLLALIIAWLWLRSREAVTGILLLSLAMVFGGLVLIAMG